MKKSFVIILLAVFTACTVKLIPPAQSDVDRVSNQYPGYSLADLNQGKALFEGTCNRCHGLKNPTSRKGDKWKEIVPTMIRKLNKKKGTVVVDEQQQELIVRYLVTMSGK